MSFNNIDTNLNDTIKKIESKYINTHPNLSKVWREYLINKKKRLLNDINECNKIFKLLDSHGDIDENILLTLYSFSSSITY